MEDLAAGFTSAEGLTLPDRAMLEYVTLLVKEPWALSSQNVEGLRQTGFSDRAILEINLAASYMSFVNRVAQGLGVELEHYFRQFTR